MDFDDKKESVVDAYRQSLDFALACRKSGLTEEETDLLSNDPDFQSRLDVITIAAKEEVLQNLFKLMRQGDSDNVRLKATVAMGRIVYPAKFIEDYSEKEGKKKPLELEITHNNLANDNKNQTAEVLAILAESGVLAPRAERSTKPASNKVRTARTAT
jgi:hypothetical protein